MMHKYVTIAVGILLLAAQATQALTISNLDDEAHYVVMQESLGSKIVRLVEPGETIYSVVGVGHVYLRDKPQQRLNIEELDRLAIWADGNIQIQMRRKNRGSR